MDNIRLSIFILLFLCGLVHAASIELQWSANSEPDLAGYKIYRCYTGCINPNSNIKTNFQGYNSYSSNGPSSYNDAKFEETVNLGKITNYTFSNSTTNKRTFYAVTAYSETDVESVFSNIIEIYLLSTGDVKIYLHKYQRRCCF